MTAALRFTPTWMLLTLPRGTTAWRGSRPAPRPIVESLPNDKTVELAYWAMTPVACLQ